MDLDASNPRNTGEAESKGVDVTAENNRLIYAHEAEIVN